MRYATWTSLLCVATLAGCAASAPPLPRHVSRVHEPGFTGAQRASDEAVSIIVVGNTVWAKIAPAEQRRIQALKTRPNKVIRPDFASKINRFVEGVDGIESLAKGNGGSHNGDMEARVSKLESTMLSVNDRLTKIETRLDHMPTKSDLSEVMNAQIKWIVGTAIVLGAAGLTIMTFVLNNAVPKSPSSQPAPTIIVNVPPQPTAQPASQ